MTNFVSIQKSIIWIFSFLIISIHCFAQEDKLTDKDKKQVVGKISDLLIKNYIFPDVAEKCVDFIRKQSEEGAFKKITDPEQFAKKLTEELISISNDKHMRVMKTRTRTNVRQEKENRLIAEYDNRIRHAAENFSFSKAEILEGNIGYIKFSEFVPLNHGKGTVSAAMTFVENSDALILDIRENRGGTSKMVMYISSYFFEEPTHLNTLYLRNDDETIEYYTFDEVDGKKMPEIPLYILTSNRTFSAGEEFAYNLQARKRATIIGETTIGGAHSTDLFPINDKFQIIIPEGRAINPVTGKNWQGVGVKPDVESSSEDALNKAIEVAKVEAVRYKKKKREAAIRLINQFESQLLQAEEYFEKGDIKKAENIIYEMLEKMRVSYIMGPNQINREGYKYLRKGSKLAALSIFKYNVEAHPQYINGYDSLGEGYMVNEQYDLAIENYNKVLELDPKNENAKRMIEEIRQLKK